jgi:2-oxo-hept-3-ene-1,7-dioate hydratase
VALQRAEGRQVIGHKIGLTSRAMQISSQIDEPDYGTLLDSMRYTCTPGQVRHPGLALHRPRVEVELAFVLKSDLKGLKPAWRSAGCHRLCGAGDRDHRRAHRAVRPPHAGHAQGLRHHQRQRGQRRHRDRAGRADPRAMDLRWVGAILRQNGVIEETGLAAGVLNHPAIGVAWLAGKLARWGETLKAGQIVLAGSFTRPVAARAGDVFKADYGPLGKLAFKFV